MFCLFGFTNSRLIWFSFCRSHEPSCYNGSFSCFCSHRPGSNKPSSFNWSFCRCNSHTLGASEPSDSNRSFSRCNSHTLGASKPSGFNRFSSRCCSHKLRLNIHLIPIDVFFSLSQRRGERSCIRISPAETVAQMMMQILMMRSRMVLHQLRWDDPENYVLLHCVIPSECWLTQSEGSNESSLD